MQPGNMLHTFAVYVDNKPGVLNRVASLFRRRAFNIESLTVGHTETPGISRMTVVVDTDDYGARRLEAHLYKLVPVRRVDNITQAPSIARDLALIKVAATGDARTHVMQLVDVYRARIVDVSPESLVIEATGTGRQDRQPARSAAALRRDRDGPHRPRRDGARHVSRAANGRPAASPPAVSRRRQQLFGLTHCGLDCGREADLRSD